MPGFTPEQRKQFDLGVADFLTHYPPDQKGAALIEVLHVTQGILGWVPEEVMPLIAEKLEVALVRVREVATFYTMFRLEPPGEHVIEVCTNVSCQLRGGEAILEHICKCFDTEPGKVSPDGKVTVTAVECLGSCGTAPMMAVDGEYRENLTRAKLDEILDELAKK